MLKKGQRAQNTGDVGETMFTLFVEQAGGVVQEPTHDRHGWDRMIEIPRSGDTDLPQDMVRGLQRAFAQVKTTRDGRKPDPIELSELEHAVKDPNPWLYIHVDLGRGADAVIRVLSVDEEFVTEVLRRQRGANVASYALPWARATVFAPGDYEAFRRWLLVSIGDPTTYAVRKAGWYATVGFEPYAGRLAFKLADGTEVGELADAFLGLRQHVAVQDLRLGNVRFGIEATLKAFPGTGKLSVRAKGFETRLIVEQAFGHKRVEVPVRAVVTPPAFGPDHFKVLLQNDFFDFIAEQERFQLLFHAPTSAHELSLEGVVQVARLVELFESQDGELSLALRVEDEAYPFAGVQRVEPNLDPPFRLLFSGALVLESILRACSRVVGDFRVKAADLQFVAKHPEYAAIAAGLNGPESILANCSCRVVLREKLDRCDDVGIVVTDVPVPFAGQLLVLVFKVEGPARLEDHQSVSALIVEGPGRLLVSKAFSRRQSTPDMVDAWLDQVSVRVSRERAASTFVPAWRRNQARGRRRRRGSGR